MTEWEPRRRLQQTSTEREPSRRRWEGYCGASHDTVWKWLFYDNSKINGLRSYSTLCTIENWLLPVLGPQRGRSAPERSSLLLRTGVRDDIQRATPADEESALRAKWVAKIQLQYLKATVEAVRVPHPKTSRSFFHRSNYIFWCEILDVKLCKHALFSVKLAHFQNSVVNLAYYGALLKLKGGEIDTRSYNRGEKQLAEFAKKLSSHQPFQWSFVQLFRLMIK